MSIVNCPLSIVADLRTRSPGFPISNRQSQLRDLIDENRRLKQELVHDQANWEETMEIFRLLNENAQLRTQLATQKARMGLGKTSTP